MGSRKIPLSKGGFAIVDDEDFESLSRLTWWAITTGYAARHEPRLGRKQTPMILMHRLIAKAKPGQYVDHINENKLDNRRENLRICTNAQNVSRRGKYKKNSTSKFKGVCWVKARGKWLAQIKVDYKTKSLGMYVNELDAAKAYNVGALRYHGDFATLNKIPNEAD